MRMRHAFYRRCGIEKALVYFAVGISVHEFGIHIRKDCYRIFNNPYAYKESGNGIEGGAAEKARRTYA